MYFKPQCFMFVADNIDTIFTSLEHMILWAQKCFGSKKVTSTQTIIACQNYSGPQSYM